jgi:hypothetical protein
VNECVVAAASRSTVTARSPVHWRLSALTRTPFAKIRYLQQVESSSLTGPHARRTIDEVVSVTETSGAAGGVVSTGSVTVNLLLFADSRPLASPAHMTNEYVLPGIMSRRSGWHMDAHCRVTLTSSLVATRSRCWSRRAARVTVPKRSPVSWMVSSTLLGR